VNKTLLLVIGKCSVDYHGRASSKMGEGQRVLMIKENNSVTVHKKDKHAPVNYQTAGCDVTVSLGDDGLLIDSYQKKNDDRLKTIFTELEFVGAFELSDEEPISVFGTEADLVKLVLAEPELIETGLKTEKVEKMIATGGIDLFCRDKDNKFVVVELKRRKAGLQEVNQLRRYVDEIKKHKGEEVRGILAAPGITERAKRMLHDQGNEFAVLDPNIKKFQDAQISIRKDQARLGEF